MVFTAEVEPIQVEVMLLPGARMSTPAPKFEYDAKAFAEVVAPTVTALAADAGET